MFRWLSRKVLQDRFFCIISWSRPVIATVVRAPAANCFQNRRVSAQSSKNQMRAMPLSRMPVHIAPKSRPISRPMRTRHSTTTVSSASVWSMSVHTRVRTPPRKVYSHTQSIVAATFTQKGMPSGPKTTSCSTMAVRYIRTPQIRTFESRKKPAPARWLQRPKRASSQVYRLLRSMR